METLRIRIVADSIVASASLDDNATTRDFMALLPLPVILEDYANTEKIAYLPRKLSTAGAPAGATPAVGDIAYYAPWGNLALYHKPFAYSGGLVRLGRIDTGIELLRQTGKVTARIERVAESE